MHRLSRFILPSTVFLTCAFWLDATVSYKEYVQKAEALLCASTKSISTAFFSPAKEVKDVILGLISNEKKEIWIAAYRLTEPDVAQALIDALSRGVRVFIITDYSNFSDKKEKVSELFHAGVQTRYYARPFSLMHDKIFIFSDNFFDRPVLVTGSANITKSGYGSNYENIIVINEESLIKQYRKHFIQLEKITLAGIPGVIKQVAEKCSILNALPRGKEHSLFKQIFKSSIRR